MALENYLNSDEVIILRLPKHRATTVVRFGMSLGWLLVSLILLALPVVGLIMLPVTLAAAYVTAPTLGVVYAVTNRRVISMGGWLWRWNEELPLEQAERVEVRQPLLARLIGAGHLVFDPYQGEVEVTRMTFLSVPRPHEFRRCILEQRELLEHARLHERMAFAVGLQDRVVQSLAAELQTALPGPAAPAVPVAREALPPPAQSVPPPPPVAPPPAVAVWYFSRNGQPHGPVTSSELQQLARTGALSPQEHVWKEGMKDWVPAAKVQGLFSGTPSPPRKSRRG
jgi:hypothetical protein